MKTLALSLVGTLVACGGPSNSTDASGADAVSALDSARGDARETSVPDAAVQPDVNHVTDSSLHDVVSANDAAVISVNACGGTVHQIPLATPGVPAIVFDTDMGPDCDDAGALAILHILNDRREATLLGIGVSTRNATGSAALGFIDAMNTFYGRPDLPIGLWTGGEFLYNEGYTRPVADNPTMYPHDLGTNASDVPEAACLYRAILAAQPDHSVTIVCVGPTNNILALAASSPDANSPLNGADLIALKVVRWVQMGGEYPSGHEFNFYNQPSASTTTADAIAAWPTSVPIVFTGFEVGSGISTGASSAIPDANPMKLAYQVVAGGGGHSSWDLTAALYGVRGAETDWTLHAGNNIVQTDGSNAWQDGSGNQAYISLIVDGAVVSAELMTLLDQQPAR